MRKWTIMCSLILGLNGLSACAQAESESKQGTVVSTGRDCELDNPSLRAMPIVDVEFTRDDGSVFSSKARLANNSRTRAAGFQKVCASTIAAMPILFVFKSEVKPSFHMHNVVAPIDIAFIDKRGHIESIRAMEPYSLMAIKKPLYSPNRPVISAFEVHPGYFKKHNISFKSRFSWNKPT